MNSLYFGLALSVIAVLLLLVEVACVMASTVTFTLVKSQLISGICQVLLSFVFLCAFVAHVFILELFTGNGYISRVVGL